ncbi:MAG: C25 family cysteine peptidase [bacterium]
MKASFQRLTPCLPLAILVVFWVNIAPAGKIKTAFTFSARDFQITVTDRGVLINLPDAEFSASPGAPALPKIPANISLPAGTRATGLNVVTVEYETLSGSFQIACCQPPAILSSSTPASVQNDPAIYSRTEFYPEQVCCIAGQGLSRGQPLLSLIITPIQFLPARGQLRLIKRLEVEISYERQQLPAFTDTGALEYLIITSQEMDTVFTRLASWRSSTGLSSAIRHIEWVISNYPGRDGAEKLRNYLKICARDSGLKFLLLGGDVAVVPFRFAFAFACSAGIHPREDSLPCDLYFSDLDGTWDANQNRMFGEVADSIDLYPDIYVGRAPVNTVAQASAFVDKVLCYEQNRFNDYQNRALFSAAVLWEEPYTDEAIAKEKIRKQSLPAGFQVLKLYESQMPVTVDTALALLNSGCGIFNHCGHGWIDALALSRNAILRSTDIERLANPHRLGIGYSIGCWTTAFDFDAIAEHFVRSPNGGGVAFIGNSSYGWGAPGNPGFGYSDRFDARFFQELFSSQAPIGEILARAKFHFIPFSHEANVYRWHQFCLNLLGDPAMPVHTDTLAPLFVQKPLRLPVGEDRTRIAVLANTGPIHGAVVAIQKENEARVRGETGTDGTVLLKFHCLSPGWAKLTVTAKNHRPFQDSIPVLTGPNITILRYEIIDSTGDANGYLSPGETFSLRLFLKNTGSVGTTGLRCRITSDSPLLTIENDLGYLPRILPDSEITRRLFLIRVAPESRNGAAALSIITITDSLGAFWQVPLVLQVAEPDIRIAGHYRSTADTIILLIRLTNTGLAPALNPTGTLFNPDVSQPIQLISPGLIFPSINPGETVWSLVPSQLTTSAPSLRIGVNIATSRYLFSDTINIITGKTGFFADFDSGAGDWTAGGTNGTWMLSSRRFNSPPYSFYAGNPSGEYPDNCHCWLISPGFILPPRANLTFARWFSVPTYGVDGLYVILCRRDSEDTLDFIGSGGALGPKTTGLTSGWLTQTYNLSNYSAGESARLKFIFVSDSDGKTSEGFYLDDIQVSPFDSPPACQPETTRIITLFPNPFSRRTTIFFALAHTGYIQLAIFDPLGRKVRTIISESRPAGFFSVPWDGSDDTGVPLPTGIYLLRLVVNNLPPARIHRKILKVK